MANIIATVRLAPGKISFYDDLTKIHLTLSNPTANVYAGSNLKQIKMSVKAGTIKVISGSLKEPAVTNVPISIPTASRSHTVEIQNNDIKEPKEENKQVDISETIIDEPKEIKEIESNGTDTYISEEIKPIKRSRKKTTKESVEDVVTESPKEI